MILVDMLIVVPFAACVVAVFAGSYARWVGLLGALATSGLVVALAMQGAFDGGVTRGSEVAARQIPLWAMEIDGLSAVLVGLTAFLAVVAVFASWNIDQRPAAHHALIMALIAAIMGVFISTDIIMFYIFWEAVLIPMYFLIGMWGHENRKRAALKFFLYTFTGSVLMLVGILLAVFSTGMTVMSDIAAAAGGMRADVVFWLLLAGMLVKVPVVPLHTWLPDAHVEAPTAGSILLAGVLLKMGTYGLIAIAIPLAPGAFADARFFLAALGVVGIVYGAAMALSQTDLKRLVAYSSVAHMGFVVVGIAAATETGMQAATLGMVSHGVVAALLFLLVGLVYERTHTRQIDRFGGMGKIVPAWATVLTFAALASLGLPGLSGFPGEFGSIVAGFDAFGWWMLPVGVGVVLAGAYNLRAVRSVNHGPVSTEWTDMRDLAGVEWLPVVLLVVSILVLGVWPRLVTDVSADYIEAIVALLQGWV